MRSTGKFANPALFEPKLQLITDSQNIKTNAKIGFLVKVKVKMPWGTPFILKARPLSERREELFKTSICLDCGEEDSRRRILSSFGFEL